MPNLSPQLVLSRCPHCSVAHPNLQQVTQVETLDHEGNNLRRWRGYKCGKCGGLVTASAPQWNLPTLEIFPSSGTVSAPLALAVTTLADLSVVDKLLKERQ